MTRSAISLILVLSSACSVKAADTLTVKYSESKYDSTLYRRVVHYDSHTQTYHVTDTYLSGRPAMRGDYLSNDPAVKRDTEQNTTPDGAPQFRRSPD